MVRIVLVLGVLIGWAAVSPGETFYVDPLGSDSAPGSTAAPWRTLQHAASHVGPGDRVIAKPGDYAGFHLTTSGATGSPIEFFAEPGVVITAQNPVTDDGINLEGASHVVIDGFEVVGMPRAGVRTVGPYSGGPSFAEFVTIRNVTSRDNGKWGILTGFVHDLLIENNRTSGSVIEHGIYVGNSGDRPVIRGNEIWDNNANGIHVNADQHSGLDGVIEDALISGNLIYNNGQGGGSGINLDGVRDSRIENNLIYASHASGISLYRIDGALPSTGNVVVNNTVHQASDGRWALNLQNGAADTTVANNIFISDHNFRGAIDASPDSLQGLVSDHNAMVSRFTTNGGDSVESLAEWRSSTGQDANSVVATADELFVDAAAGDYRLREDSPARDAGWAAWGAATDRIGAPRPYGPGVDLGASELVLPGDYNADGVVDAADYTVWRDALDGDFNPLADGDNDGEVTHGDRTLWEDHYGQSLPVPTGALPEPGGAWVLVASWACGAMLRDSAV